MSPQRMLLASLTIVLLLSAAALAHGAGHVMGTIAAFDAKHLEVVTQDGKTQAIALTEATKYFVGDRPGSAADLAKGLRVVVHLAMDKTAMEVHLPAKK
ncbi:MAG: hypothetical protein ACM3OB_02000 [Acidobacteriota bacterium]